MLQRLCSFQGLPVTCADSTAAPVEGLIESSAALSTEAWAWESPAADQATEVKPALGFSGRSWTCLSLACRLRRPSLHAW